MDIEIMSATNANSFIIDDIFLLLFVWCNSA